MAEVLFYEKPGCINNTEQKQLLIQSGHKVISRNLLDIDWDIDGLRTFFGDKPVNQWFNYSAPAIKDGWIDTEDLSEQQALTLMICEPLLIRRPLMRVGNEYMAGFDIEEVSKWIGLQNTTPESNVHLDMESCPQQGA